MVDISASMVKELREKSGAAMMDCKKALVESSGDFDKAFEWLRQKGVAAASQKSSRTTSEGLVVAQVSADGKVGGIAEINCETDFVARNEEFAALTKELATVIVKEKPKDADDLLTKKHGSGTVKDLITEKVQKTGENIVLRRVQVFELKSNDGVIGLYVHALGGKMGAIVEIESNKAVDGEQLSGLAREVAMHTVSTKPQYLSKSEVPKEIVDNEVRIESGKADLADKKPEMREKIVTGRVDKILAERCLLEQPFVKEPGLTVAKYVEKKGKELGADLKVVRFALYILGEAPAETNGKS